jgi:hypothetical protein
MRSERKHRRPRAATVLCTVGWLLPLALGCRLTDPDEVDRRPNVVRGSDGRESREPQTVVPEAPDSGADAPALPDVALPSDRFDVAPDSAAADVAGGIDRGAAIIDAGDAADPIPQCTEEGEPSCDDFDRNARRNGSGS